MCTADYESIPWDALSYIKDFDLYDICYMMSSEYVSAYPSFVYEEICDAFSSDSTTTTSTSGTTTTVSVCDDNGLPTKDGICALNEDEVMDYVADYETICGSYDEEGNYEESPIVKVCADWSDVCTNGLPDLEYMCHSLEQQPASLAEFDIDWFCCDISSDCVAEPQVFYTELVDLAVCENENASDLCDATTMMPTKDLLC